jgi:ATP-dependent Lon protease
MDGAIAAQRGGIKTVLIPEENAKDLVEIVDSIKRGLEIIPVSSSGLFALNREISVCAALVHYCLSPH